jgi:hypothetical protein
LVERHNFFLDPFIFLANFGMANFDLFKELQASDYHSPTQEHVLVAPNTKVPQKNNPSIDSGVCIIEYIGYCVQPSFWAL